MSDDFFKTSDGEDLTQNQPTGEFDGGGGDFDPIPAKTQVLAAPDEAKWDCKQTETGMDEFISVRWVIYKPDQYKGRKIFQKIRVLDPEPKKVDKAKRMLTAIDANAGGTLVKLGRKPTDADLAKALINKFMMLMLQVWKSNDKDGNPITGNWVSAVAPKGDGKPTPAAKPQQKTGDFDDDIPF